MLSARTLPRVGSILLFWVVYTAGEVPFCGTLQRNDKALCPGYLIGSKWALTVRNCIKGFVSKDLNFRVSGDNFNIVSIRAYPYDLTSSIDLALIKLNRGAGRHGTAILSPNYPEEGISLTSSFFEPKNVSSYITTMYSDCEQLYGYRTDAFCIIQTDSEMPIGSALHNDGLLTGLLSKRQPHSNISLAMAIAPAFRWITDTMSEIIVI